MVNFLSASASLIKFTTRSALLVPAGGAAVASTMANRRKIKVMKRDLCFLDYALTKGSLCNKITT